MKKDFETKDAYFSYMLRIWRFSNDEVSTSSTQNTWRVSLENTQTRKQVHFASLEDLLFYLQGEFAQADETSNEV